MRKKASFSGKKGEIHMTKKFRTLISICILAFMITMMIVNPNIVFNLNLGARSARFVTVFISIFIQALPFVLIGVFGSALMHNLISVELIETKLAKTGRLPGILLAIGAGFFFPVCDCGVIPVVRRLLIKKVPPYMAIAFLVTAPLVNPITVWATATAFGYNPAVTFIRVGMAVLVGMIVSLAVSIFIPKIEQIFNSRAVEEMKVAATEAALPIKPRRFQISEIFTHANQEFAEVVKFLIVGSLIAATIQTFIPKQSLIFITKNPALSVFSMMVLALSLSLCAEADAFVARSFTYHFPLGSVMAFMVFGQMLDIKNLLLLLKSFRPQALGFIFGLCAALVFTICVIFNLFPATLLWGRF
jgi:uncharacterized membrane protein YraQ (UPF0718 family)